MLSFPRESLAVDDAVEERAVRLSEGTDWVLHSACNLWWKGEKWLFIVCWFINNTSIQLSAYLLLIRLLQTEMRVKKPSHPGCVLKPSELPT